MREPCDHQLQRVLVVGVGSIGERHVRCFLKSGRARVSICETNERLREEVGNRYEIDDRFADLDEALSKPHDAAVIAVPADLHIPIALKAADAGLHLLIEKPLSVTSAGISELQNAVLRKHLTAAVGYVYRAHPALHAMRTAIREGTFGRPLQLVVVAGQNFPTYRPAYRDSYYTNRARGGGAIQDAMTHLINAAEWLVGPIDRVVADIDHKSIADLEVEDVVNLLARHGDVIGSYSLNQFQAPNEATITVICEQGTARFEYHHHRWLRMMRPDEPWREEPVRDLERDSLFIRQAESFLDAIERRSAPLCSFDEGLQSFRVNRAIFTSVENRSWQAVGDEVASFERRAIRMMAAASSPKAERDVQSLFDLRGRVALVTGAGGHLGSAISRGLAEAGARVVVTSRDARRADSIAAALPNADREKHIGAALDQTDFASIDRCIASVLEAVGQIDVLVNNAHEPIPDDWESVKAEDFQQHFANLTGYFVLARHVRNEAVRRGRPASIVMLGSMYGVVGSYPAAYEGLVPASPAAYHALKGGIVQLTRHLAVYWAKDGVRVNCLSPGPFPSAAANPQMVERLTSKSPMGRMGEPCELKGAVLLLASDAGSYITGQNLIVDGGWTAW